MSLMHRLHKKHLYKEAMDPFCLVSRAMCHVKYQHPIRRSEVRGGGGGVQIMLVYWEIS